MLHLILREVQSLRYGSGEEEGVVALGDGKERADEIAAGVARRGIKAALKTFRIN